MQRRVWVRHPTFLTDSRAKLGALPRVVPGEFARRARYGGNVRGKSRVKGETRDVNAPKPAEKCATKGATPPTDFAWKPGGKAAVILAGDDPRATIGALTPTQSD